jgi:hypothetical protein
MTETEVEIRSHKESRASEVLKINSKSALGIGRVNTQRKSFWAYPYPTEDEDHDSNQPWKIDKQPVDPHWCGLLTARSFSVCHLDAQDLRSKGDKWYFHPVQVRKSHNIGGLRVVNPWLTNMNHYTLGVASNTNLGTLFICCTPGSAHVPCTFKTPLRCY